MKGDEDLKLAAMLTARLCHDLAGPLAAIGNGMELLNDPDFGPDPEASALVADSAAQATASLRFLRSAFGVAGEREGRPEHLQELTADWLGSRGIRLDWGIAPGPLRPELGQLLLNLAAVAADTLPRGGEVTLAMERAPAARRLWAQATGRDLQLRPELRQGLEAAGIEGLGPRAVQAFFLRRLAAALGGELGLSEGTAGALRVEILLPPG